MWRVLVIIHSDVLKELASLRGSVQIIVRGSELAPCTLAPAAFVLSL